MINIIGGYLVFIFSAALISKRKEILVFCHELDYAPVWQVVVLICLELLILIDETKALQVTSYVSIPCMLLSITTFWVHEAGHALFMFFGEFLHILGGSVLQLLYPAGLIVLGALYTLRRFVGCAVFWLGYSMVNLSYYIADARTMNLELVGGGTHDWHYLLLKLSLLDYDHAIATCAYYPGILIALAGISVQLLPKQCHQTNTGIASSSENYPVAPHSEHHHHTHSIR